MSDFVQTATERHTSPKLMQAIFEVAHHNEGIAEFIWEMGPTQDELRQIIEIVTENGKFHTTDFSWGVTGTAWAEI